MADPKKNPLIGAFRTPAPGSTPVTSTEGEPKTAPPVQDTPPKAAEPPKDAVPKVKADATAHTTPGDVKKSQEPSDPEKPSTGEVPKLPLKKRNPPIRTEINPRIRASTLYRKSLWMKS